EFTLPVLERVASAPPEILMELLDEARDARLVAEGSAARSRMRFAHVLVRDTLYERLPSARRLRLHRDLGRALAEMQGDAGEGLAEVAHHLLESAALGDVGPAIAAARRAAEHAVRIHAYEEAARLLEQA